MPPRTSAVRRRLQSARMENEEVLRKIFLCGSIAVLLTAIVWAGDDPWKAQPYQQWDAKDVRKVLAPSPWARNAQVAAPWYGPGDAGDPASGGVASQPSPPARRSAQTPHA